MKDAKKKWAVIGGLAVVILVVACLLCLHMNGKEETSEDEGTSGQDQTSFVDMKDGELIDYEAEGMLKLGEYKGLTVTVTPTDTEVYQSILLDAEDAKVDVENADRVQKGDWISLDYVGYIDEVESENLNESAAVIQVGAGSLFNAAFDRGLMGLKIGQDYTLNITFPEDYYDGDVAGEEVTFSVTVNAKFNDDYAKAMSKNKYKTVEEYFAHASAKEEEENREAAGDTAWDALVESCKVKEYPEGSKKQAYADQKRSYKNFAEMSGMTYEDFLDQLGYTEDDVKSLGNENVRDRMIAKTIAKKEGLKLTDKKYEQYLLAYLEPEEDEDKTLEAMEKRYKEEQSSYPRDDMLISLVKDYLVKQATLK